MEGNAANVQFIKVTKESVLSFLEEARKRIVIAKAGYFADEINALLTQAKKGVRCDLYVDTDENSVRYGFGEQAALELINENLELLNVHSANYIRMAIIIVDDAVMVYSPVALSWEEVPDQIDFPNGFIGGKELSGSLLRQIEGEPIEIKIEGLNIAIQTCPVIQKAPEEIKQEIAATISVLKENPPVDPAELRKTTFYRHKYKLLKMTLHGVRIKNKSISLRPFNAMFPKTNMRLKSSWNVLTHEDVENLVAINDFLMQANAVTTKHTFDAKRYGTLIELKNIRPLENCIAFLVYELVGHLIMERKTNEDQGKIQIRKSLVDLLKDSRKALIDHLFPQAMGEKGCWNELFANDQTLYRLMQQKKVSEDEAVKQAVETYIDHRLNFPNAQEMIDLIHVEFDYYDISDELLAKEDFVKIVETFDIEVRDYQEGYEKNKQMNLFETSE
jgi:hypothetical protein